MIGREEAAKQDRFGFLNCKWTIKFKGGIVSPIPEFDKVAQRMHKHTNQDGFFYPPLTWRAREDTKSKKGYRKIPRTKRPAPIYKLPASHDLCLYTPDPTEDIRHGSGAFVIQLLAYLFETRLQFYKWWFDGRVPIKVVRSIGFTKAALEDFLSHCYQTWQGWGNEEQKKWITNLLYMHTRAVSYEWDWERFIIEYMVLDGCWKLAEIQYGVKAKGHSNRIKALCEAFDIPYNSDLVNKIVKLRNNLFHQTLWDDSQPGTTASSFAFQQPSNLHRLNQRLIPALLGYKTPYVKTDWWSLSPCWFEQS